MNANQRRICDGLAPDEETPISSHMDWLREHCERLAWELEATTRELHNATAKLRAMKQQQPDDGTRTPRWSLLDGTGR